jgi:hypothetical protein
MYDTSANRPHVQEGQFRWPAGFKRAGNAVPHDSPRPRSLFVRLTVIPLPLVLMIPLRDPRGRPRFVPRPDGRGLPVTSILLANGRGKAEKRKHKMVSTVFGTTDGWFDLIHRSKEDVSNADVTCAAVEAGRSWAVPRCKFERRGTVLTLILHL